MSKKAKQRNQQAGTSGSASGSTGEVGPRQPCPCGSGKRYKACHGAAGGGAPVFVARPFEGLASECDWIALRELVPAATAPLAVRDTDRVVRLCTLLPGATPAMVRESGEVWLGLQVQHQYGDPSRELAAVLDRALARDEPGAVGLPAHPGEGPRLQDRLEDAPLDITVHDGFDFWVSDVDDPDGSLAAAVEQASGAADPTARLASVDAAWWVDAGTKEHLRWVMPHPEDALLDALARLHAAGRSSLGEGTRLVGMFRSHGLLTPVWDLPVGTGPEAVEDPATEVGEALAEALAADADLTSEERSARAGLANRQVTIR